MHEANSDLPKNRVLVDDVMEHLPIAAGRFDRHGTLCFANREWLARLGRSRHDVLGRPLVDILNPDALQQMTEVLTRALAGETVTYITDYTYPAIGRRHLEITLAPDYTASGPGKGALIFINDATEKISLRSAQKDIADYITALDAHAIVAVTDAHGVITWVNDKFCKISQYSREELYGRTHAIINSGYHPKRFFVEFWQTITRGNIWQGEICNRAKDGSRYWVHSTIVPFLDEDGRPEKYIAIRADITKLKQVEQEAQYLSRYDFLTGLPNRRVMHDRLDEMCGSAGRCDQHCALLAVDLDELKKVNDYFGHQTGDHLLVMVSRRLNRCLRKDDMVARVGGDEFYIILTNLGYDADDAAQRAYTIGSKILAELAKPYLLERDDDDDQSDGGGIFVSACIGAEVFLGDAVSRTELLKQVDLALYHAKKTGRNRMVFFDASLQEKANLLIAMEHDLRRALEREELFLVYQPIVDGQRKILGMEALIRWQNRERGMVAPDQFITLAEQVGLIVPIGQWVLEQACKQLLAWAADPESETWTLSVNVSARQFGDPQFVDHVLEPLVRIGANPKRLILELTETTLLSVDEPQLLEKIERLKRYGIQIALDDFGTGYSSLTYLRRLPLDRIKIDQSFVRDLIDNTKDQGVVQAILSLANTLRLHVVAEGIETPEQLRYLCDTGCPGFQGYLLGKPSATPKKTLN